MKNLLMYMYNLKNINIYKSREYIKITTNDKEYLLYEVLYPTRIIEIDKVLNNKTEYYKIIKNINNEIITIYQNKNYVLLQVNNEYQIHSKEIILNKEEYENYQINQSNWINLWSKKNDYYETLTINNLLIEETINYYIGIAENAIEFLKYNDIYTDRIFICNSNKKEEYNPLNIVLDCKEREIGEIIKREFFYNDKIININKLKDYNLKKIIARLLYPNYYFDIVDEFIQGKVNEDKLKRIINKQSKYEQFIKEISNYDKNILLPEWIKKDK